MQQPGGPSGPGSSVGIATVYRLDGPGIESRWGGIFRTCPDRLWGPPSLVYNGYRVFPGGRKGPVRDADPSPLLVPRPKNRPWGPPSLLYNGYRVFPGVKSGRGVKLTPHPLLVPWSRKGRAIPLLPLWTVRPVQSLSACTRVHFTLTGGPRNRGLIPSTGKRFCFFFGACIWFLGPNQPPIQGVPVALPAGKAAGASNLPLVSI